LLFNFLTDYVSLFVIRPLLVRSGTKPVIGLALGTLSAVAIVYVANLLRMLVIVIVSDWIEWGYSFSKVVYTIRDSFAAVDAYFVTSFAMLFIWPAMAVFTWLPLFALGILIIRALSPLSWIVEKAQWALKEGDKHPLKAIGCVAAVVVFAVTVGLRAVFTA
jgi:hypothetical protein